MNELLSNIASSDFFVIKPPSDIVEQTLVLFKTSALRRAGCSDRDADQQQFEVTVDLLKQAADYDSRINKVQNG